jgi:hypothetical protein
MRKTSVYLTENEAEAIRRIAIRDGRPQAELIREGVRHVIAQASAERRQFRSLGAGRGGGKPYERWPARDLYERAMGRR